MKTGLFLAASPLLANAAWQMNCAPVTTERLDPVVFPGIVSPHVHSFAGGSGITMKKPTNKQMQQSSCTSCQVKADKSSYWHPELYFQWANGSFTMVPSIDMQLSYYQNGPDKIGPFPEGFRMVSGGATLRSNQSTPGQIFNAVQFTCIGNQGQKTPYLPTQSCQGGIIAQVEFPSCWDGKNLDSADHQSHVTFAGTDPNYMNGGNGEHSFALPGNARWKYSTNLFDNSQGLNTTQPFVFAMGDPTGWGFHADFINGWDTKILTQAINTCTSPAYGFYFGCKAFGTLQATRQANAPYAPLCHKTPTVNEEVLDITLPALPGCNPVQYGPQNAVPPKCSNSPSTFPKPATYSGPVPPVGASEPANQPTVLPSSSGYKFGACYGNVKSKPVLTTGLSTGSSMTAESCLQACRARKYKFCGLSATKCYGGQSLAQGSKKAPLGDCYNTCTGNNLEFCGGPSSLSIYQ